MKITLTMLLVTLLVGCRVNSPDFHLWATWSNMAVSYPMWAAITPSTNSTSIVHFVDLRDGTQHRWQWSGMRFTGIESVAGKPGKFAFTVSSDGANQIVTYDTTNRSIRTLFETELVLLSPFLIDGLACALHPTGETKKQRYDFQVICDKEVLYPSELIESAFYSAAESDRAAFIDGDSLVLLRARNGRITLTRNELPGDGFFRNLGFVDGTLALYDIKSGDRATVYRLEDGEIVPDSSHFSKRIDAIDLSGVSKVLHVDAENIVSARLHEDKRTIELLVWSKDGELMSSVELELLLPTGD